MFQDGKKLFFAVDSGGYTWCLPSKDLIVSDVSTVKAADVVNFKDHKKILTGKVLFTSGGEEEVQSFINSLPPRNNSAPKADDAGKESSVSTDDRVIRGPRGASLKQRQMMEELVSKQKSSADSKVNKGKKGDRKTKQLKKQKRSQAALMMESSAAVSPDLIRESSLESEEGDDSDQSDKSASSVDDQNNRYDKSSILRELQDLEAKSVHQQVQHSSPSPSTSKEKEKHKKKKKKSHERRDKKSHERRDKKRKHENEDSDESSKKRRLENEDLDDESSKKVNKETNVCDAAVPDQGDSFKVPKVDEKDNDGKSYVHGDREEGAKCEDGDLKILTVNPDDESNMISQETKRNGVLKKESSPAVSSERDGLDQDQEEKRSGKKMKSTKKKSSKERRNKKKKKTRKRRKSAGKKRKTKKKSKKRPKKVKRNTEIYKGQNYVCGRNTPGAVQLHSKYEVYILQEDLDALVKLPSANLFIRQIIAKIYTEEALKKATPTGLPPRGKGKKLYRGMPVLPMLHPDGMKAISAKVEELEAEKKNWRPKLSDQPTKMRSIMSNKICSFKTGDSDSSSSSSDSSSSSSDSDSSSSESSSSESSSSDSESSSTESE